MKKIFFIGGGVLLLAAAAYFGRPYYREWKERRALAQAREFLAQADYRNALLSVRTALSLNAANPEGCRLMARVSEGIRSPHALDWWQRAVNLEPKSVSNRLAFARAALLFGNPNRAEAALAGIAAADQNSATYHQLAAMTAVAENNLAKADWHFGRAAQLDPQNKAVQFNEAVIHLQAKNPEAAAAAEKTLQGLVADPLLHRDALRLLALTAIKNKNFAAAGDFAAQLEADPGATFDDRVLRLSVAQAAARPDFAAQLETLKTAATTNAAEAGALAAWLTAHDRSAAALQWLAALPDALQTNAAVRMARADTLLTRRDWTGLETYLQDQNWNEFEFVRLAELARANAEQKQTIVSQASWQAAVRAAGDRLKALTFLTRLAGAWGWEQEREDLLWNITQHFPGERWALQSLDQLYQAAGNTRGLQRVYATLVDFDSTDMVAKNNLASILLLLNVQTSRANELAHAAYTKYPQIPAFASTYAYSLHLQGQTAAGLKVFRALPPEQLAQPGIAVYYGVLLAAAGETGEARKYLALAANAPLLPEEKALLQAAGTP